MKSLKELCIPRESVFDIARRDTVLNLSHLTADKIDAKDFFEENYVTEGMKTLLTESFRRMQMKSQQAVFKLTQAMGGGKTHNLITLGMLAKHPEFRNQVLKDLPGAKDLPPVRVVAFSGRETDVPNGIWGEIARQLGKEIAFKDYYSPLKAPGRSAWINLLIRPTDLAPVIVPDEDSFSSREMRWGWRVPWDKSPLINAKSETLTKLPTFAPHLQNRCLILADGFFEKGVRFIQPGEALFALAGLWQKFEDGDRFTMLTTTPNASVSPYHHRMPFLLQPGQ